METQSKKYSIIADYYSQHYEEVLGFVSKRMMYAEGAEDIVQNVFVRLLRTDKMITPITLPCLVYTTARNLLIDYWRHHQSVEEYEHFIVQQGVSDDLDVASVYSAVEITEILERGIARLTDHQRTIYRMNIYEGKKVSEISETLHLTYKSVESRLGIARKEIRQYMKRMLA
jgi:RNA polymerase sigma-70 factor (ECF subfamily)